MTDQPKTKKIVFELEVAEDCDLDLLQEGLTVFIHEGAPNVTRQQDEQINKVFDLNRL